MWARVRALNLAARLRIRTKLDACHLALLCHCLLINQILVLRTLISHGLCKHISSSLCHVVHLPLDALLNVGTVLCATTLMVEQLREVVEACFTAILAGVQRLDHRPVLEPFLDP